MKKTAFIFGSLLMVALVSCNNQEATEEETTTEEATEVTDAAPPAAVAEAFATQFPGMQAEWEQEEANEWEAEFKKDGIEYSAAYDNNGMWIETEHEIDMAMVPEAVKNTLAKDFAEFTVGEAEMAETANGTLFEFELKMGEEEWEVIIDGAGVVVSKQAENEANDEDHED